jgi:1,5-anhydro-D-fructose reductase (1,5-anhydro-D-mannitol-forming)
MSELGWGFIGASTWARRWLIPAVRATAGAVPVAVFSTSDERGREVAEEAGLERSYDSLDGLLADPAVDAVYISTRNGLHAAQAISAARAGKHVLCEKPMALSVADAIAICEECERAGVTLAVDHHFRGAAPIVRMRELVAAGAVGTILAARVFHARSLPTDLRTWRLDGSDPGAGIVLDVTVHDADVIRFLLDDEVEEVTAVTSSGELGRGDVADTVMGVMRMRGGALVSFHDSFVVPHAPTGIEIHGTDASLVATGVLSAAPSGQLHLLRGEEREQIPIDHQWPLYERVVQRFMAAVRGQGEVAASGEDGARSVAVALAAAESAASRRPVRPGI